MKLKSNILLSRLAWLAALVAGFALAPQTARADESGTIDAPGGGIIAYTNAASAVK